ncbi:hypothetical protein IVB02_26015 [Bradyrhizobium sp. 166]|uniref:hypothetical protein n=1 Tax=Bradyrhizobium sp. 166 TaxID=2782638 RepID=UPI001FF91180|nr:hypothetical protein [Bradyrhizobium sp. 166]MCK1604765.1 hypothetical protein [Bradyrhizobium sp. 166]
MKQLDAIRGMKNGQGSEADMAAFSFGIDNANDNLNTFESNEGNADFGDVLKGFDANGAFGKRITAALQQAKSKLTAENIIARIRTQTCAGAAPSSPVRSVRCSRIWRSIPR